MGIVPLTQGLGLASRLPIDEAHLFLQKLLILIRLDMAFPLATLRIFLCSMVMKHLRS